MNEKQYIVDCIIFTCYVRERTIARYVVNVYDFRQL